MSKFVFQKAVKAQEPLRLALDGPAGSGKTFTALRVGTFLAAKRGGRIAVIDSERSSAKKYASLFDFDHLTIPDTDPHTYIEAVKAAEAAGYAVIIVDSLSHAWEGTLELKDRVQKRSKSNDGFGAWREVTPVHNELVDVMLRSHAHVIATMRTKTEYLVERNEDTGKNKVSKVGTKPMQRTGVEFEFDVVGDMDIENNLVVSKTRCPTIRGAVIYQPGEEFAGLLYDWLEDGEPLVSPEQVAKLVEVLNGIVDQEQRVKAKGLFRDAYDVPDRLVVGQFDEALKFAEELATAPAEESAPAGAPFDTDEFGETGPQATGPADVAPVAPSEEPSDLFGIPKATAEQVAELQTAVEALPEQVQEAAVKEITGVFGPKAAQYAQPEIKAAIQMAQLWPTGEPVAEPAQVKSKPLNAKQRALVAYARGKNVDHAGLVALASFMAGTLEPRPLDELDDVGVKAVTGLVDEVAAGRVVLEAGNNGGMVAKEVQTA